MSTEFRARNFSFSEPGTQGGRAQFTNRVRDAGACIQGLIATFPRNDHHLKQLTAEVENVRLEDTDVAYDVVFNLIDGSNNKGSGEINVLVIADVEAR
jgi:hypothetical protein